MSGLATTTDQKTTQITAHPEGNRMFKDGDMGAPFFTIS